MEIPSNIAARIGEIEAKFTTPVDGAAVRSSSAAPVDAFASVLAASLAAPGTDPSTGDGVAGRPTLASLIASAAASRPAALRPTVPSAVATGNADMAIAASSPIANSPIASKDAVKATETQYRGENGRLPDTALTSIGGSHKLTSSAANAFQQLRASALADGVEIGVTDSYRSYDSQVDVARRKGLYSQGGLAAKPGTSDHGLGLALDLDLNSSALTWMRSNAGKFGFVADTPRESWHWKFDGV